MARTVDQAAHAGRRAQFLDAAQHLLHTKGYERMSVHDVWSKVGASKGAFYHYFDSKQALVEAVMERMADQIAAALAPVAADPHAPALEKLQSFFTGLGRWKAQRRDLLVALLEVWQSDDNAIVRQKLRPGIADRIAPLLAGILEQGAREAALTLTHPQATGRLLVALLQDLNDRLAEMILSFDATGRPDLPAALDTVAAHTQALERILGLPEQSILLVESAVLRPWFTAADSTKSTGSTDGTAVREIRSTGARIDDTATP
ncbi:TetR/AcrR family transcriptional regulator [Streptosporangium sp. H16]|uniref:TetR/AcrR family transcriptional regulator n=1 Tax=Streptosporangium sp. H16 TaxID=3444184 RepID=UPI003F7963C7